MKKFLGLLVRAIDAYGKMEMKRLGYLNEK